MLNVNPAGSQLSGSSSCRTLTYNVSLCWRTGLVHNGCDDEVATMNTLCFGFALAAAALGLMACSGDAPRDTTGAGGSGGSVTGSTATKSSATSTSTSTSSATSGSGGSSGGICGNPDYTYGDAEYDACVTASCCDSFNACVADTDCDTCIGEPDAAGCSDNTLFGAYETCTDASCPEAVCDTDIVEATYECNGCVSTNCCSHAQACVGDGTEEAVELCISCINDPDAAACNDAAIKTTATAYNDCAQANCQAECYR
jgi:hypothetical protein